MGRHRKDGLDFLFGSLERFVCGSDDSGFRRRTATSANDDGNSPSRISTQAPVKVEPQSNESANVTENTMSAREEEKKVASVEGETTTTTPEVVTEAKSVSEPVATSPERFLMTPKKTVETSATVTPSPPTFNKASDPYMEEPTIGIEKDPVSVSIRKATPDQRTHLELVSYYEKPGVYVKTIKAESKFLGTILKVGMKLLKINGEACPPSVKETIDAMNKAENILTLTAVVVELPEGEDDDFMFREIRCDEVKPARSWMPQFRNPVPMQADSNMEVHEKEVKDATPGFAAKALFSCMYPTHDDNRSRDGDDTYSNSILDTNSRMSRKERIKSLKSRTERDRIGLGFADGLLKTLGVIENDQEDEDSVQPVESFDEEDDEYTFDDGDKSTVLDDDDETIRTFSTYDNSTINNGNVIAKIVKKNRRDNVGIHFVSFKRRPGVYIYKIHPQSKFQATKLEAGMKVITINGKPCPDSVSDTLSLVKGVKGELIIEAMIPNAAPQPSNTNAEDKTASTPGGQDPVEAKPEQDSSLATAQPLDPVPLEEEIAAKIPSTIGVQPVSAGQEPEDKADDDESIIYESLPPPKHEENDGLKGPGAALKAALSCAVGDK